MTLFILWAHRTDYQHQFTEVFSSLENVTKYLNNHPEVVRDQVTEVELDPK